MSQGLRQLGTPDPQSRNSPICELGEEEVRAAAIEPGETSCFFNGEAFPQGSEVQSGAKVLRCDRGTWVETPPPEQQQ
ncbi:hypothetical protein CAI21_16075 [Alkalilimnicola ehrlichii]|uniref:Uncharacterized protein n=1 Tax=Alkalilimnicola ehrlichii TaxID=351052 RepID=A0A3E0WLR0_9GAMM|nr:hypothetical protein [Alkalilimnicola ehrlichii]RFA26799.1 hypothetical protein CAI21_16075 [Alkalilimnicola ehrlichii]RFA33894.1 hypothetical protein CAL65_16195 [Alkalilimnicola ehrlichii]